MRIRVASTEIGQGTRTMLAQIVADALGVPLEQVEVAPAGHRASCRTAAPPSRRAPRWSWAASCERCAEELRERLGGLSPAEHFRRHGARRGDEAVRAAAGSRVGRRALPRRRLRHLRVGVRRRRGRARPRHLRGEARRSSRWCRSSAGRCNPALARGQIEGGTAQGRGLGADRARRDAGRRRWPTRSSPTTSSRRRSTRRAMETVMLENPYPPAPFGAKGLGELPMDGPGPGDRERACATSASTCARSRRRRSG